MTIETDLLTALAAIEAVRLAIHLFDRFRYSFRRRRAATASPKRKL